MRNVLIRTTLAGLIALSWVFSLACGGAGNANNQNAAPPGNSDVALRSDPNSACKETDINEKLRKVRIEVADKLDNYPELWKQKGGGFDYEINIAGTSLEMTVTGTIGDYHDKKDDKDDDNFFDFVDEMKRFERKGCISAIHFKSPATSSGPTPTSGGSGSLTGGGFTWFACEEPNVPCDGVCVAPPCNRKTPAESEKGNRNANVAGNTNPGTTTP